MLWRWRETCGSLPKDGENGRASGDMHGLSNTPPEAKSTLFSEQPYWLARNPSLRRAAVKLWRKLLRLQRATVADVKLVVRDERGRTLAIPSALGELRLPGKALDGWRNITIQVQEFVEELLGTDGNPRLLTIEGAPSARGMTFVFSVSVEGQLETGDAVWVEPNAPVHSSEVERLLLLPGAHPSRIKLP
jgi:hypothetical protein